MTDDDFDFGRFEALTFDCYGTLIDWEAGLTAALRPLLDPHGIHPDTDELLETYAAFEAELERPPYRRYRDVLATAARGVTAAYGVEPSDDELATFGGSVGRLAGLSRLGGRACPTEVPLQARRPDQLRRRPVRGLERPTRGRVRLDRDRAAGRRLQARPTQLRGRSSSGSRCRGSASSTSPRACTTTTCRRRPSACTRSGSTGGTTARAEARHHRPMRRPTGPTPTWRPSPRPPSARRAPVPRDAGGRRSRAGRSSARCRSRPTGTGRARRARPADPPPDRRRRAPRRHSCPR